MYLNCKTYFSYNYGTFSTHELVEASVDKGITALSLTNINSTCDTWEFVKLCRENKVKPIVGAEVRNNDKLLYILIAANNKGFAWINEFLSEHLMAKKDFPEPSADLTFFENGWDGFVIYPIGAKPFKYLRLNERIGVKSSEINKLFGTDWRDYEDKFVIRQPVTVQNKIYHNLHRLLRAVDNNVLLSQLTKSSQCEEDEIFMAPVHLMQRFQQYPFMIANTYKLMDVCKIEMEFHKDKTRKTYSGSLQGDKILLEKLAMDGLPARYTKRNKVALQRLQKELKIIDDLGFNSYFLINHDIVCHAKSRGFYHVGRGSGANSIVAYCMGITDVDPIELNLYFERFLNPERTSPPDFDIDFSYTDRDEVMDYVFKRYGTDYVCLLGAFTTYKNDSIIRELGKVFGLPKEEIEKLQRTNMPLDTNQKLIMQYGTLMKGFPSNCSVHACGMLISEEPLYNYVTLFMPPKGFATCQMDMFTAEDIGLNKYDILSQRGLGHIKEALRLIKQNKQVDINIHDTNKFKKDFDVSEQIKNANTIGCFYIESPAMRHLLMKLRCNDYLTLVAASSIIRPGVSSSGMMREYIYFYHNRDKIVYLHPLFEEHLSETFGVMVFQEDVIKITHYYAGLSLGRCDIVRRAMSGKYRSQNEFDMIMGEFFAASMMLGRPEEVTPEVWRRLRSFGGYSFNKAHSASFAVESYMSLYLKTYYPKEFMVAVINNFGGFYSTELYFIELFKAGGRVQPPCINFSDEFTNIHGSEVYVGFIHIKGLRKELLENILEQRNDNGAYLHLQNFIERIPIGIKQLELLIHVGAFRFTGKSKKQLLWEAHSLVKKRQLQLSCVIPMFSEPVKDFKLPDLSDHPLDDIYDQIENLGFPLCNPFGLADDDPAKYTAAKDLNKFEGKYVTVLIYFIAHKQVPTKNGEEMYFGTFLDSNLNWVDTVHFPESAKNYPLNRSGFFKATGKVTLDFGVVSLEVTKMESVGYRVRHYADL